jgi:hypothetical protein
MKTKKSVFVRNFDKKAIETLVEKGFKMSENTSTRLKEGGEYNNSNMFINVVNKKIHLVDIVPAHPFTDCGQDINQLLNVLTN